MRDINIPDDGIKLSGLLQAIARNRTGDVISDQIVHNRTVTDGSNLLRDLLAGESSSLRVFAVGTGTTPTAFANHTLDAEVWRSNITAFNRDTAGQLRVVYFLPTTAANGNVLSEVGIFGGDATATANTGTLYARAVLQQQITKDQDISVEFVWTLLFEAV